MSGEWVYVSGPVTGIPGGNRAAFEEAASRLEAAGFGSRFLSFLFVISVGGKRVTSRCVHRIAFLGKGIPIIAVSQIFVNMIIFFFIRGSIGYSS